MAKAVVPFHERRLASFLHDLFSALKLEPPPWRVLHAVGKPHSTPPKRLRDLVEQARKKITTDIHTVSKQSTNRQRSHEAEVIRLGIQRAFGVRVEFGNSLPANLEPILRRVARTLSSIKDADVAPSVITIDGGCETSVNTTEWTPCVHLGACASETNWTETLSAKALLKACEETRERDKSLRESEHDAAGTLGVRMILCEVGSMGAKAEFLNCYASVVDELIEGGVACEGMSPIAVMLTEREGVNVDVNEGIVRVGVKEGAAGVVRAVRSAQWVGQAFEDMRRRRAAERHLIAEVRKLIGAKRVYRAEGLGEKEWETGLRKLRERGMQLGNILSGLSVWIGQQARVLKNGEIEIPFNFDESMKI